MLGRALFAGFVVAILMLPRLQLVADGGRKVSITAQESKILATLQNETTLQVLEMPLAEIVKTLGKQHSVNLVVDQLGLDEVNVSLDQRLSCNISRVSLDSTLRQVLEPLDLDYAVRDDALLVKGPVLYISSKQRCAELFGGRAYDISHLILRDFPTESVVSQLREAINTVPGQGGVKIGGVTSLVLIRGSAEVHQQAVAVLKRLAREQKTRREPIKTAP